LEILEHFVNQKGHKFFFYLYIEIHDLLIKKNFSTPWLHIAALVTGRHDSGHRR